MANKYTVMSEEAIRYMCGLIRDIVSLPTDVINNINLSDTQTFSNIHIKNLIDQCLQDANKYSDEVVNALTHLVAEKIDFEPTLDNTTNKLNTLLLYSKNNDNNYTQYLRLTNELLNLGDTSLSLTDYLKITDAASTYTKQTDFNSLKTEVDKKVNKTDLTTHTDDTDIHITSAERTKWDKVDNKIDKTSILTAISASPSDNNLLSEQAIKIELDKKSNNTDLYNLSQGILVSDAQPMNENILLWDVGHYYFNSNATWRKYKNIPSTEYAPHVYVTSVKPTKYKNVNLNSAEKTIWFRQIKVDGHLGKSFIRTIYTPDINDVINIENGKLLSSGSDTGWQRICTTSVEDVPLTKIVFSDTTYYEVYNPNITAYEVVNGICYLQADVKVVNKYLSYNKVLDGIPRPKSQQNGMASPWNSNNNNANLLFEIRDGSLFLAYGEPSQHHLINIAYPVAES